MYFTQWPFRVVPEDSPEVWADRAELRKSLEELFLSAPQRRRSSLIGMWGYLGAGKSHSLLYFRNLIHKAGLGIVLYSPIPKELRHFADIYRQAFFRSLNFVEFATKMGEFYLKHSNMHEFSIVDLIARKMTSNWLDMAQALFRLGKAVATGGPLNPLVNVLNTWLSGTRLPKSDLRTLGLSSNLTYDGDYVNAAASIIRSLTFVDSSMTAFPMVFWMIDDCHYLAELKKSKKVFASVQQGLRDVFDACPEHLCTIVAFAARQEAALQDLLIDDLYSRVSDRVNVPPLTKEDCLTFIRDLFGNQKFRSASARGAYYPFTQESASVVVDLLTSLTDMTPRNVMKLLEFYVATAEREIYPKTIHEDFVKSHFEHYRQQLARADPAPV